jgi:Major Facilitator Superfamily.
MNKFPFATSRYSVLQAFYWTAYCMTVSFASVYLLAKNYNNAEIGVILALVNILAVFLQLAMAAFIDKTSRISLKNFMCVLVCIILILSLFILLMPDINYTAVPFMVTAFGILVSIQPFINAICFKYERAGIKINYGIARGIGSGAYALASIVLGYGIARFGAGLLPVYYIVTLILFLSILFTFAPRKTENEQLQDVKDMSTVKTADRSENSKGIPAREPLSVPAFLKKYKTFSVFIAGSSLVFFSHFLINTFMIQIMYSIGGGSAEMGTATFIAAMMEIPVMFAFSRLKEKVNCGTLLKIAVVVFTVKHLLAFLSASVSMFYLAQFLQIGGYGLYIPASVYYVEQIIDKEDLVKGQAMITGAMTLGSILASLIGGILLDHLTAKSMLFVGVIASVIGSMLMLFSTNSVKKQSRDNKKILHGTEQTR